MVALSLSETKRTEPNGTLFHGYYFRLLKSNVPKRPDAKRRNECNPELGFY